MIRIDFEKGSTLEGSKIGGRYLSDNPLGDFIAQINLSELPESELPKKGWLQFFIDGDKGHVEYIKELNGVVHPADVLEEVRIKEAKMVFREDSEYMSYSDFRFPFKAMYEQYGNDIYVRYDGSGSKIFGYPHFCHEDPRTNLHYDTLLLQLDSNEFIKWGDSGVGNFFINSAALKFQNFTDILFYWDSL